MLALSMILVVVVTVFVGIWINFYEGDDDQHKCYGGKDDEQE